MLGAAVSYLGWAAAGLLSTVRGLLLLWLSPVPLAVTAVVCAAAYHYMTKHFDYWPSRGVKGPTPRFPWGHRMGVKTIQEIDEKLYHTYGGKNFCGYTEVRHPALFVGDPDLIRAITVKDFEYFSNRRDAAFNEDFELMVSQMNGQEWKDTRSVITPTFSSSKLKAMHQLCLDNADNLNKYLREEMDKNGEIDMKDSFGRFTMDNIASCAFGVNSNSFADSNSEFTNYAKTLFRPLKGYALFRILFIMVFSKKIGYKLPDPNQPSMEFFRNVVMKTLQHREQNSITSRRDFLQLLLETKDKDGNRILSEKSIIAQSIIFFIAGYDTTATLLMFSGYALATNPNCQRLVHEEIEQVLERHNGQITYEAVSEMHYLDRVISETLRLYSPAIRLERCCSKEYTLPGTDVRITPGVLVQMPVFEIHRDPDNYPEPLRFDPDRFLPAARDARHPGAYLPFGAGPRNCLAMRFALFEAKVALVAVLREHVLEPGPRTPPQPLEFDKSAFILTPKAPIFLKATPRKIHAAD